MPVSSTSLNSTIQGITPLSIRERHCGFEDWFRYIGGGVSFIGGSWCYFTQNPIPGALLTITGVTIVIVHITEKNCGVWARATRAANRILQNYNTLLETANQTATRLQTIDEQKHTNELQVETKALLSGSEDVEKGVQDLADNLTLIKAENLSLLGANKDLQTTIQSQGELIRTMEQDLERFTVQNNQLKQEIAAIHPLIATLSKTDKTLSEHVNESTVKLQTELDHFNEKITQIQSIAAAVQELKQQNERLQREIEQLSQTKEALSADLEKISQIQQNPTLQMTDLALSFQDNREGLAKTEESIRREIAELRKTLEGNTNT